MLIYKLKLTKRTNKKILRKNKRVAVKTNFQWLAGHANCYTKWNVKNNLGSLTYCDQLVS